MSVELAHALRSTRSIPILFSIDALDKVYEGGPLFVAKAEWGHSGDKALGILGERVLDGVVDVGTIDGDLDFFAVADDDLSFAEEPF